MKCNKRIISLVSCLCVTISAFSGYPVNAKSANKLTDNNQSIEEQMKDMLRESINNDNTGKNPIVINNKQDLEEEIHILVKLKGKAALDKDKDIDKAEELEESVINSQNEIIDQVKQITGSSEIESYGYLVNGFSVTGKRKHIEDILKINNVESAVESPKIKINMVSANKLTEAAKVWQDYGYKGEGMVISVLDTGTDVTHKDFSTIESKNLKINKEKVSNFIDETGRGKYFSDKIPFGYNYVEENNDVKNPDQDHGMHVAGIAVANGQDTKSIKGVAPEAQLLAMKVSGQNGEFYLEDCIKAIEDSVKLGADVINMSFGIESFISGNDNLFGQAIANATKKGILCVYACGNSSNSTSVEYDEQPINKDHLKDTSTISIESQEAFSVASMENMATLDYIKIQGEDFNKEMQYSIVEGASINSLNNELEYVYCNLGYKSDFKSIDVQGKVAVIDRGIITFTEKYNNALNNGAVGVIVVNNENGIINMSVEETPIIPLLFVDKVDGQDLKNQIEKGNNIFSLVNSDGKSVQENSGSIST